MVIAPKRLAQEVLGVGITNVYVTPTNTISQVSEIWITNGTRSLATVNLFTGTGTTTQHMFLKKVQIPPESTVRITDCRVIMGVAEKLSVNLDYALAYVQGAVSINVFGIEEEI